MHTQIRRTTLSSLSLTKHINDFLNVLFENSIYMPMLYVYIKGKLLNCDWPIVLLSSDIFSAFLRWRNFSLLTYKWLILHNRYSKLLSQLVQGYQIFILQSIKYLWRSNGALYNQFLLEMNVQSHSLITNQQMQKNLLGTDLSF